MSKEVYESLKKTAIAHIRAYESPKPFDNDAIQQFRDLDCIHYLHPVDSIVSPFNEPIRPTQFVHAMEFFGGAIESLKFDIQDLIVDTEQRTVVVRMKAIFDFKAFDTEDKVEGYTADYMWLTEMNPEGKIVRVEEFLDPLRLMGYVKSRAERYAACAAAKSK